MNSLARKRCFNHANREAAGRCGICGRYFCRECVTDHEERLLCSVCLQESVRKSAARRSIFLVPWRAAQFASGVMILWLFFYYLGVILSTLPSSFHDGTIWRLP